MRSPVVLAAASLLAATGVLTACGSSAPAHHGVTSPTSGAWPLLRLSSTHVCGLVPTSAVAAALAVPAASVQRQTDGGTGLCVWRAGDGRAVQLLLSAATWSFVQRASRPAPRHAVTIAGHPGQTSQLGATVTCELALGGPDDPTMSVQAPSAAGASSVAAAALQALHR